MHFALLLVLNHDCYLDYYLWGNASAILRAKLIITARKTARIIATNAHAVIIQNSIANSGEHAQSGMKRIAMMTIIRALKKKRRMTAEGREYQFSGES